MNNWKSIILTTILVLLIPAIMTVAYFFHLNDYLTSIPANNCVSCRIMASVKKTGGSGSVGNEWCYYHAINSTSFKDGEIVEINTKKPFTITSTIIESDSIDDIGKTTSNKFYFGKSGDYTEDIVVTNSVRVDERGGRKNSGAYALFSVNYVIKRVLPRDYAFFNVYFFTENQSVKNFLWGILFLEVGTISFIAFLFYANNKRELQLEAARKAEEEERRAEQELRLQAQKERELQLEAERKAEEERQFQAKKSAFISSLEGRSLRDVAGVPVHIRYKNGFPVDNNDAEYGSFTVYLSRNGKCFHGKKGCSSAYLPAHYFTAKQKYIPCSKCNCRYHSIPAWHTKYMDLKFSAQLYGIEEENVGN